MSSANGVPRARVRHSLRAKVALSERLPTARRPTPRQALKRVVLLLGVTSAMILPRKAPGTVAEQRSRLPPPVACESEIEGLWKAHTYNRRYRRWTEFTLQIRRVAGSETELEGKIFNHTWYGNSEQEQPGPCQGRQRWRVSMNAEGSYRKGEVRFKGTFWKFDELLCGRLSPAWGYNLDFFSGKVDRGLQEFQSVNNDGGLAVNVPYVFRRIGCLDMKPVRVKVKPPPLYPQGRNSGCGC